MTHFYATLLKQSDEKHAAVMAAASNRVIGPALPESGPNLAIKPPTESKKDLSDLEKAQLARAQGKEVELNDDNQIVDKRALLSAGLNLTGKNTRDLAAYRQGKGGDGDAPVLVHTAVGAAASRREIDARRRREVEVQLAEEEARKEAERYKEEEESRQRAVKRKNDDESIMSARERYLERKRRKLEQPPPMEEDE
jgi:coiled-coil domain-containing protein 55